MNDLEHMRHALGLAERALGRAAPNPAVGCVLVAENGRIAGRGHTAKSGRPHAETVALAQAGDAARGATAYVTLEPCAHIGQTPACAAALVRAGVRRVVAAMKDTDPRVQGRGFLTLRTAGIEIAVGVLEKEAATLNAGFFLKLEKHRPLITLKIAQSGDGKTIPPDTSDRWITSQEARRFGHLLRGRHDAILVGVKTVLADDPELTCRLPGLEDRSPMRVVLDTCLRTPLTSRLAQSACAIPTLVFTTSGGGDELRALGIDVIQVRKDENGRPALAAVLDVLAERGCTRLLVEGGQTVWSQFLSEGPVDRMEVFTAPVRLGDVGTGAVAELRDPKSSAHFRRTEKRMLGPDMLESYVAAA